MMRVTPAQVAQAVGGRLLQDGTAYTALTTDSRAAAEGMLFIPIRGERFDGHHYIDSALQAGASGCITAVEPENMVAGKSYILVEDTRLALGDLAGWYRRQFQIPFVQITGSAGKTTTKQMMAAVLGAKYDTLYTQGNFNNDIGTPQTLLRLGHEHEAAVIETGMNHFGEIEYLGAMVQPDIAVITNVGDTHIENLGGTRQGILQAKCEIFTHLKQGGVAILNGDDALLRGLSLEYETVYCGKSEDCDVRVTDIVEKGIDGLTCTVTTMKNVYHLSIPAPGGFMIYPAAMAVAVAERLGLSAEEIERGVMAYESTGNRMRVTRLSRGRVVIDDSYNANPQAMAEALGNLAKTDAPRKMAVLGDMGELGDLTEQAHRDLGILTKQYGFDAVFAVGDKAKAITEKNENAVWFATVAEAMDAIRTAFIDHTMVLIKASHAMAFHTIAEELEKQ